MKSKKAWSLCVGSPKGLVKSSRTVYAETLEEAIKAVEDTGAYGASEKNVLRVPSRDRRY